MLKIENKGALLFVLLLVFLGLFYRFIDHLPNFSPLAAIALFAGFYLQKKWSFLVPLSILFVSDFFLGFYNLPIMISVYVCFGISSFLGIWLKDKKSFFNILGVSMSGSLLFFAVTNFSVWLFSNWYSKDLGGLLNCYYLAIPFFRNTFLGDLFFVGIFFGAYETAVFLERKYFSNLGIFRSTKPINL